MSRKDTDLYFTTVLALSDREAVLGGHLYLEGTDPSITRVSLYRDGQWLHLYDMDDIVYGAEQRHGHDDLPAQIVLLGRRGLLRENPRGRPASDSQLPRKAGYFFCLREVDGRLYACGTQNQLLRQEPGGWVEQDQGLYAPLQAQVDRTLFALDGFAHDDLYAVGMQGAIWHWDGNAWHALGSPTNVTLHSLLCAPDGEVYIGGAGGVLLRGRRDRGWSDIGDESLCRHTIESLAWFRDRLYAAGQTALLCWDGTDLRKVVTPAYEDAGFLSLDACAEALWSVGNDYLLSYDGQRWQHHPVP